MIFHVIAEHDHTTCGRVENGVVTKTMAEISKTGQAWVEGNDDVTVLGVWGYPVSHRIFAVVEAETPLFFLFISILLVYLLNPCLIQS